MELDDNLKQLTKELGMAISESLSNSESISEALSNLKDSGYDVFLVLEATIGFDKREKEGKSKVRPATAGDLHLTPQDTKFLKSLKISVIGLEDLRTT